MPTNPHAHPRRFSYASVVSAAVDESTSNQTHLYGTSASPETTDTNYQRSASSIHPLSTTAIYSPQLLPSATTTSTTTASVYRHLASLATTDADMQMNYGASGAGWRRPGGLPAYSRQFANLPEYAGAGTNAVSTMTTTTTTIHSGSAAINLPTSTSSPAVMLSTSSNSASSPSSSSLSPFWDPSFFVPSYLRNSRYIARLEAMRRSKLAVAQREYSSAHMHQQQQQQTQQSQQTQQQQIQQQSSLSASSASSSHVNIHRMAPSHRGMTYDIVEKEPMTSTSAAAAAAALEDRPQPLPSRWNENDKHDGLDLTNDGMEVRYLGHVHKPDHEAASVRSDFPMPREGGIYYFEATILNKPKDAYVPVYMSA